MIVIQNIVKYSIGKQGIISPLLALILELKNGCNE